MLEFGHYQAYARLTDVRTGERLPAFSVRMPKRELPVRVASYWLLAWFMVEAREHGNRLAVQGWECPRVVHFQPADDDARVRIKLPAAAYIACKVSPHTASTRRLLLLPDLGTAPVARYRETLRRVVVQSSTCTTNS